MRILFVADGRSPIALNWIRYFINSKDEVHLVSTFACEAEAGLAGLEFLPVAFSGAKRSTDKSSTDFPNPSLKGRERRKNILWGAGMVKARTAVRQWLGPVTLPGASRRLLEMVEKIQPDLVHAMRIPYEGMLAALALERLPGLPLLVSVWGNDFTLHGQANPWMKRLTQRTLERANALHTDCERDERLARAWGFGSRENKPAVVLPGNGGIDMQLFHLPMEQLPSFHPPMDQSPSFHPPMDQLLIDKRSEDTAQSLRVINPRGVRAYVRNDSFFQCIPLVLRELPGTRFACLGMQGEGLAESWLRRLGIEGQVELLPKLPRQQVAELFRECAVAVSPTTHDGTPNTLLEAMASGCFPVVGDLESLREWITQGENGMLVDPADPAALAQAVIKALRDPALRQRAGAANARLVAERAEYQRCMSRVEDFYQQLIR